MKKYFCMLSVFFVVITLLTSSEISNANPLPPPIITFDDLQGSILPIPNGYGGFFWNNFYYLDGVHYHLNPSGYQNGVVSPNNVAFNESGGAAFLSMPGRFTFIGASLTAAWNDGLNIEVQGYAGGNLLYDQTVVVDTSHPFYFEFNYANIDNLHFRSFGGIPHPDYVNYGEQFAMDNFDYKTVPEPATMLLLGIGLIGVSAIRRNLGS